MTRIVKLQIVPGSEDLFEAMFTSVQEQIAAFDGCSGVKLLRSGSTYFTISQWEDEAALERYRNAALFRNTWAGVKPLFAARAEAWSLENL